MTSLGEVYGRDREREASTGRLYAGAGLFLSGVLLVVAGIVVATTDLVRGGGVTLLETREYAGIVAGVGVPAVFLGILTVLPADRETRVAAAAGAAVAALGVGLFAYAYPCRWSGAACPAYGADLTLPTVGVYALGMVVMTWYLFVGIATFKRRNDPGGTVKMTVTKQGETRVVEVDPRRSGSVGQFGVDTARAAVTAVDEPGEDDAEVLGGDAASTDGGTATRAVQDVDPETGGGATPDRYCGNCAQFEYVKTADGMQPYCGLHDEVMDDVEPCEQWESNGR